MSFSLDMPMISLAAVTRIQNQGSLKKSISFSGKGYPSFACKPVTDNALLNPGAHKHLGKIR